jgi:serine/threonine-protein kinase RsbW
MDITLTLALPRDRLSVPVVRHILSDALMTLGLEEEIVQDIELALTEACTNVLDHSGGEEEYEVSACIDNQRCVIEIVDRGRGFDPLGREAASPLSEEGRGISIMQTLMDRLEFVPQSASGTTVRLEKKLVWDQEAVLSRLERRESA